MDTLSCLRQNPEEFADLLTRRTPDGRYIIGEHDLVLAIRASRVNGDRDTARDLCGVLLARCEPVFLLHTRGLIHRFDLREEALSSMRERLLSEAINPREEFLVQNFIHALRCLCFDQFKRVLREDRKAAGLMQTRTIVTWLPSELTQETAQEMGEYEVIDPYNPYEQFHAQEEVLRLLRYLPATMDRTIVILRAVEQRKWSEIARDCHRTERAVRLRYERAREVLRGHILAERAGGVVPEERDQQLSAPRSPRDQEDVSTSCRVESGCP